MNKDIMRQLGFGDAVDKVEMGICPFCDCNIDHTKFKPIEAKEYLISGLCADCQREIFDEEGECNG